MPPCNYFLLAALLYNLPQLEPAILSAHFKVQGMAVLPEIWLLEQGEMDKGFGINYSLDWQLNFRYYEQLVNKLLEIRLLPVNNDGY